MAEKGKVISVQDGIVTVSLERTEACAKCRACIAGMTKTEMLIQAKNICQAQVNDWVNIELENDSFLNAVAIMYGVPFVAMILGFLVGYYGFTYSGLSVYRELIGFACGMLLMVFAYHWIKSKETYWKSQNFTPIATKILITNENFHSGNFNS